MNIKFCKGDGCKEVAIGVSRWDRDVEPVDDYCRKHYLSDVMGEPVRCEVIGPFKITDVRTQQGVARGGVVELDPLQTNIPQLVYAGHVKVLDSKPASAKTEPGKAEAKKG